MVISTHHAPLPLSPPQPPLAHVSWPGCGEWLLSRGIMLGGWCFTKYLQVDTERLEVGGGAAECSHFTGEVTEGLRDLMTYPMSHS